MIWPCQRARRGWVWLSAMVDCCPPFRGVFVGKGHLGGDLVRFVVLAHVGRESGGGPEQSRMQW